MAKEKSSRPRGQRRSSDSSARAPDDTHHGTAFPVVGIGASAGGLEALKEFFAAMPADSGMAFVVIQHLDPTHKSHMRDVLARYTEMRVVEPQDRTPIEANAVYTIPPNTYIAARDGELTLSEPVKRSGIRMPIDFFFRSLADDQHERAIAVLLSGSGSDGTLGLREIRGAGGTVLVQDPATAQYDMMPQNAIFTGLVDQVLPAREMPAALLAYAKTYIEGAAPAITADEEKPDDLNAILALVVARTRSDFRCYKKNTIRRRIQRQMGLHRIDDLSDYLGLLRADPEKVTQLAKDLLIGVTSFFRDAESFEEMRKRVIVPLVHDGRGGDPIRVWVPGCATGEEAYSIAMLLLEEMAEAKSARQLQVFASDIDEEALKVGRAALYPENIASDVSEERLARFFIKGAGSYQIDRQARETMTFAVQNLISDPPFSRVDLISCRNVLIYLETEMQRRVIALFAYALNPGGFLFLGKSDGIVGQTDYFEPISGKLRVFRRTATSKADLTQFPMTPDRRSVISRGAAAAEPPRLSNLNHLTQLALLEHFGAAAVVVDRGGTILHFLGDTGRYLDHPTGDASLKLLDMTRDLLSVKLAAALREAAEGRTVVIERVPLRRADALSTVNVSVHPVDGRHKRGEPTLAVIFEESPEPATVSQRPAAAPSDEPALRDLIVELSNTKEELQATIEELETSNEELQAANEEVTSTNEELQSTNEELETSKEELQSLNEELTTVNNQMQEKVDQLGDANSDLANLFVATDIPTLFLDQDMHIRRFTPSVNELMRLIPSDVGRPIADISHQLVGVDLAAEGLRVLRHLERAEKEVSTPKKRWYSMRIMPYRTLARRIDGVVVTFHDVSRHKQTEKALRRMKEKLQRQVERESGKLAETHDALEKEMARRGELSRRLLRLQDDERQRIARELHDSTAQNLAGLNVNLALIEKSSKGLPPKVRDAIRESSELIYAVMREVRTVSYLLHPPLLEEAGLVSAVRAYVDGFAARSGLHVRLNLARDLGRMPLPIKTGVFRIIQEALTNIHRHSGSTKASIRVLRDKRGIGIEIEDGGRGFPPGILRPSGEIAAKVGTGIGIMQERLKDLGGTLRIRSKRGRTVLNARIPHSANSTKKTRRG